MAEGRSIPVRLSPDVIERLDRVAERTGMSRNALMKFCVSTFAYEMESGELSTRTLQAWQEVLKNLDGRTHRYGPRGDMELKVAEKKGKYPRTAASRRRKAPDSSGSKG